MLERCPGRDRRKLKAELVTCAGCGDECEIFSDEGRVRCPGCGAMVERKKRPTCADWCRSAGECFG